MGRKEAEVQDGTIKTDHGDTLRNKGVKKGQRGYVKGSDEAGHLAPVANTSSHTPSFAETEPNGEPQNSPSVSIVEGENEERWIE